MRLLVGVLLPCMVAVAVRGEYVCTDLLPGSESYALSVSETLLQNVSFSARVRNHRSSPYASARPGFKYYFVGVEGDTISLSVQSAPVVSDYDEAPEHFLLTLSVPGESPAIIETAEGSDSAFHIGKEASFLFTLVAGAATLYEGENLENVIGSFTIGSGYVISAAGVKPMDGAKTDVLRVIYSAPDILNNRTCYDASSLCARLEATSDPWEGYWQLLDYELDDRALSPGGSYTLALVGDVGSGYRLLYLDGAVRSPGSWSMGMVKAILKPTPIAGTYACTWFDSEGLAIADAAVARLTNQSAGLSPTIDIQIPSLSCSWRFCRIPAPQL